MCQLSNVVERLRKLAGKQSEHGDYDKKNYYGKMEMEARLMRSEEWPGNHFSVKKNMSKDDCCSTVILPV